MALLTTLLVLLNFILASLPNTLSFDNQSFNEAKSSEPSASSHDEISNMNKLKHHNHCQNHTWLVESKTGECECADTLDGLIYCDKNTKEVFISSQYCMSYDINRGEEVVGRYP